MRAFPLLAVTFAAWSTFGTAYAAPRGSIECPLQAMSAKDRAGLGVSMINDTDAEAALTAAHNFIADAAKACVKINGWTFDATANAVSWTQWRLMTDELMHETGLTAADLAILRAYVDEDVKRVEGLDRLSSFQRGKLVEELRRRGAHLHEAGDDADRELEVMMLTHEMRIQEAAFAGS